MAHMGSDGRSQHNLEVKRGFSYDDEENRDFDKEQQQLQAADAPGSTEQGNFRRKFLREALLLGACGCGACLLPDPADALAQLRTPPKEAVEAFDLPRNKFVDASFACGMFTGMGEYEAEAAPKKAALFKQLLASLPRKDAVIAEVGIGSFPNAKFFTAREAPTGMDIIGIDPNDEMKNYALENARRAKITGKGGKGGGNTLRIVHGVSEALPLEDASCDAVLCTLTLCSVVSPEASVAEVKRVLKPGGKFLFWEHVLSETDPQLARTQKALTPQQVKRADGCHLDRRTGEVIKAAGFASLDLESFSLTEQGFLNPTVAGIATA